MKLSDQGVTCIMMALQKGILEKTDITEVLKDMDWVVSGPDQSELVVVNPPTFEIKMTDQESDPESDA